MSLLYRAIWNDDRDDLPREALAAFQAWVARKSGGGLPVPEGGRAEGTTVTRSRNADGSWIESAHPAEVVVRRGEQQGSGSVRQATSAALVEHRPDGSRWTTTLRTWSCTAPENSELGEGSGWLWVDVEAVSSESMTGTVIAAPVLVRTLLDSGVNPRRRCVVLQSTPSRFEGEEGAEALAELLSHGDRDLPIVVFSDDPATTRPPGGPSFFDAAVAQVAVRTAGIAATAVVDPTASAHLAAILGRQHSVWGGALRMYLPDVDPAAARDGWRHRYVTAERYLRYRDTAATVVTRALAPAAAARREPGSYAAARQLLGSAQRRDAAELLELLAVADEETARQRTAIAEQENTYADLLADYQTALEDRARLTSDLESTLSRLRYVESLVPQDAHGSYWQTEPGAQVVPATAATPTLAALLAQEHLADHLALPDEALVDLEALDAALESGPWGQTSWEALRALHAYGAELAAGNDPGSFWTWCENSGHPLAWRATPKKLSMTESESVENNEKFRRRRVLPVSTDVDPSGRIYMPAHVKVAEGGGDLAPRIYFHPSRETGKVHVGYFGPHRNMPNTRT
ncbi:hypothetical protein [Modestobacter sp. SYSU DS0511]